jgi:hypothetical protein
MFYNIRITKQQIARLLENGNILLEDIITDNCPFCEEELDIELQLNLDE